MLENINEYRDKYLESIKGLVSIHNYEAKKLNVNKIKKYCIEKGITDINNICAADFITWISTKGYKKKTIISILGFTRQFFIYLYRNNLIENDIAENLTTKVANREKWHQGFYHYFADFVSYAKDKGLNENKINKIENHLARFSGFLGKFNITELNQVKAEEYINWLLDKKLSNALRYESHSYLKKFFRFLESEGIVNQGISKTFTTKKKRFELQDKVLKAFKKYMLYTGLKQRSIYSYLMTAFKFKQYLNENDMDFKDFRYKDALEYLRELNTNLVKGKLLSRKTINCRINALNCFYGYLQKQNIVFENPFRSLQRLKEGEYIKKNTLSVKEAEKFLNGIDINNIDGFVFKVICELLLATGLRITELGNLKVNDIDFMNSTLFIRKNKENRPREVVVCEYAMCLLKLYSDEVREKYLSNDELAKGLLFKYGGSVNFKNNVNNSLARHTKNLKMKSITSHCFRHTTATLMFKNGATIREVQAFLGHKKLLSTVSYTRISTIDMKKVLSKSHPRERKLTCS